MFSCKALQASPFLRTKGCGSGSAVQYYPSKLLLHFDAASGTTFYEEKTGVSLASYGLTAGQTGVFGNAVKAVAGNAWSRNAGIKAAVKFNWKTGFTIEFWTKTDGSHENYSPYLAVFTGGGAVTKISLRLAPFYTTRWKQMVLYSPYSTGVLLNHTWAAGTGVPTVFSHVMVSYDGAYIYVGLNGKIYAKNALDAALVPDMTNEDVYEVAIAGGSSGTGQITDEFRLINTCEYSGEVNGLYVVPTAPFTV